jgi:hypothetical protein
MKIMKIINCKRARREIDEMNLDQQLSSAATEHLSGCAECRSFRDEHRALRDLVASLETVGAPADFDFRLRARLAREKGSARRGFDINTFAIGMRPIAAAGLVLLIVVAGIEVKSRWSTRVNQTSTIAVVRPDDQKQPEKTLSPAPTIGNQKDLLTASTKGGEVRNTESGSNRKRPVNTRGSGKQGTALAQNNQRSATKDSAVGPAPVFTPNTFGNSGSVLEIPLNAHTLKFSIDNGRGRTRTILLPTITFGSQRVVERSASFAPVSSSKGAW